MTTQPVSDERLDRGVRIHQEWLKMQFPGVSADLGC